MSAPDKLDRWWCLPPFLVAYGAAGAALVYLMLGVLGCAAPGGDFAAVKLALDDTRLELAAVRGDFSVLKTTVGEIQVDVQAIGDIKIGGGGDSVVSWIQAAGLVLAALAYPLGWRPIRHLLGRPSDPLKVRVRQDSVGTTYGEARAFEAEHQRQNDKETRIKRASLRRSRKGQAGKGA